MQTDRISASASTAWTLARGQAQTFRPQTAGLLRTNSGRVWATLSSPSYQPQPRWCPDIEPGDIFLGSGATLHLAAGQTVVIESWPSDRDAVVQLEWAPDAVSASAVRWQQTVGQPAKELAAGLVMVGRSFARLVRGLAGYSDYLVAGRGKVQTCLESNAP